MPSWQAYSYSGCSFHCIGISYVHGVTHTVGLSTVASYISVVGETRVKRSVRCRYWSVCPDEKLVSRRKLVVETRNFVNEVAYGSNIRTAYGTGDAYHLTERFRRDGDDRLHYEYTVDDPLTFTRTFTVALPMRKLDGVIFEYACHEGNYGLYNQLSGARAEDREAAEAAAAGSR